MSAIPLHRYRFWTLTVESEFPLRALPDDTRVAGHERDLLRVVVAPAPWKPYAIDTWRHQWCDADGGSSMALAQHDNGYLLRIHGLCDFIVDTNARQVAVHPLAELSPETLEHLLVDQVLPRMLEQRGHFVVHASVIHLGARCILLLGDSGWGKSTLAGLFHQQGHTILSDDCALLCIDDAVVSAHPTYPSLRMYDHSIQQTFRARPITAQVADYTRKRRVTLPQDGRHDSGAPISAIYLLNDPNTPAAEHAIEALPPVKGCMALIQHSFRLDMALHSRTSLQLQQAASVCERTPIFSLSYPRDFKRHPMLTDLLTRHVESIG